MSTIRVRPDGSVSYLTIVENEDGKKLGTISTFEKNNTTFRSQESLTPTQLYRIAQEMEEIEKGKIDKIDEYGFTV